MREFEEKNPTKKTAIVLKAENYILMQYLVEGKTWFLDIETQNSATDILGNIYKGKVKNTSVNGMAFLDIGIGQDVFLSGNDFTEGDYVLVQIIADEHEKKRYKASTRLNLSSSLCYLETSAKRKAVKNPRFLLKYSQKLSPIRLKSLRSLENQIIELFPAVEEIRGLTLRTNTQNKDNETVLRDIGQTLDKWKEVRRIFANQPRVGLIIKADGRYANFASSYLSQADCLITNDDELAEESQKNYTLATHLVKDKTFVDFESLKKEIENLSSSIVKVDDNVSFQIDRTEACTFIDVNAGGYKRGKDEEQTKLQINLKASGEIMRQISLRNIGGPIIIDFISMKKELTPILIQTLETHAENDRQRVKIYPETTNLGMVEMERKRTYRQVDASVFAILFE